MGISGFRYRLTFLLLLWLIALPTLAAAPLEPFAATYRLQIDGWPDATIHHQLTRHDGQWESAMQARIAFAEGNESSRFRLAGDHLEALLYTSSYRLFGMGSDYRLNARQLAELPDRQTALLILSRQALSAACVGVSSSPCTLRYRDYRGDLVTLNYRVSERGESSSPSGRLSSVSVDTWRPDKPARHLMIRFTPDLPGLLLGAEYRRDGELVSTLALTSLDRTPSADQPR